MQVFEREARVGGHTNTALVPLGGRTVPVDTGFIVFNRETYPNLCRLLDRLGVAHQESDMSFSVSCEACRLEWCGTGLGGLLAQPSNALRPSFVRMLSEIVRFNREAPRLLTDSAPAGLTLSDFLDAGGYSAEVRRHYLYPMAAAVWSSGTQAIERFPAALLVRFFQNHGFLGVTTQYRWRTVTGGGRTYVEALTREFRDRIHAGVAVLSVTRDAPGVTVTFAGGSSRRFDAVVLATHADEALALLADPTPEERRLLSPWSYSRNEAVLHSDASFLPRSARARASWNYRLSDCRRPTRAVAVTYSMNRLQSLAVPGELLVTLNPERPIGAADVHHRTTYTHPVFTLESLATQEGLPSLNGARKTWFAGAYFGNGLHEDGLNAGLAVADGFGVAFP